MEEKEKRELEEIRDLMATAGLTPEFFKRAMAEYGACSGTCAHSCDKCSGGCGSGCYSGCADGDALGERRAVPRPGGEAILDQLIDRIRRLEESIAVARPTK